MSQEISKLEVDLGDVVRWNEDLNIGIVKEIRVIDTAELVKKFSGDVRKIMLKIRTSSGSASVWPGQFEILKVNDHEAKEFKSQMKSKESHSEPKEGLSENSE